MPVRGAVPRPALLYKTAMLTEKIELPGKRLPTAASFIRRGAYFADIGTDHALLPIYAVKSGTAVHAIASDVNEAPLLRAKENIRRCGLEKKIDCMLTSGFDGMGSLPITDAAICGMGGELTAEIINGAPFIRRIGFRLIIQPMTRAEAAREALGAAGFCISVERTVYEDGKFYTIIAADHDGIEKTYDKFTLLFGDLSPERFCSDEERRSYIKSSIKKYERIIEGKSRSQIDVSDERSIVCRLSEML